MTRAELIEVVYRFYPRGLYTTNLGYDDTEERQRQSDAARRGADAYPTWKAMIRRLGKRYSFMDRSMPLHGGSVLPAYSAYIEIPGHILGFHVSLLGPYYGIRRTGAPGEESAAMEITREIEATYPGYAPIPPELGNEVVPDVALDGTSFGEVTICSCLFSEEWESCSSPWPPPPPLPPSPEELASLERIARTRRSEGRVFVVLPASPIREPREPLDEPRGEDDEPGRGR